MFNTDKKIESLDHKNLPKAYKPDDLKTLNEAREAERKARENQPEPKPESN